MVVLEASWRVRELGWGLGLGEEGAQAGALVVDGDEQASE